MGTKSKAQRQQEASSVYFASTEVKDQLQASGRAEIFRAPLPGPQTEACLLSEDEILFGGARGPGKSFLGYLWLCKGNPDLDQSIPVNVSYLNHPSYRALVLRKYADDLKPWVQDAIAFFCKDAGSPFNAVHKAQAKCFVFPSGAVIYYNHLEDSNAYLKYRGHQYTRVLIEELTLIPDQDSYLEVQSSVRSVHPELRPQMMANTNPDGPGLDWVKKRFLCDPQTGLRLSNKTRITIKAKDPITGELRETTRIFLPAKITDNPILLKGDPGYYIRLKNMSPAKQRAYIEGDWDALSGSQFFEDFRPTGPRFGEPETARHCYMWEPTKASPEVPACPLESLESWWPMAASLDWGYNHRAVMYWGTKSEPDRRVIICDELSLRRVGAHEAGAMFAEKSIKYLNEARPQIVLWASPDAFQARNAGQSDGLPYSIMSNFAEGVQSVLGKKSVFMPNETDLEVMAEQLPKLEPGGSWSGFDKPGGFLDIWTQLRTCRIVIRRAPNQRIPGWDLVREHLRWRDLIRNDQQYDHEYALKLISQPGGGELYCRYYNSLLEANKKSPLPKLWILADKCPYLLDAIPRALYDEDGEDTAKVDVDPETGLGGDDEIDSLRYLLGGFHKTSLQVPKELAMRRALAEAAKFYGGSDLSQVPGHLQWQVKARTQQMLERKAKSRGGFSIPRTRGQWQTLLWEQRDGGKWQQ